SHCHWYDDKDIKDKFHKRVPEPKDQQRLARASIFLLIAFHARPLCRETEGSALSHPIPGTARRPSLRVSWLAHWPDCHASRVPTLLWTSFISRRWFFEVTEPDGFRT